VITAICTIESNISCHTPMFWARSATGRRVSQISLRASNRISIQLLSRANRGASGKAATNIVMNPNCKTTKTQDCKVEKYFLELLSQSYYFIWPEEFEDAYYNETVAHGRELLRIHSYSNLELAQCTLVIFISYS